MTYFDSKWLSKHDVYGQGPTELDAAIDAARQVAINADSGTREQK